MQKEPTVGAWAEDWFKRNSVRWSANTVDGYRNLIDHHIIPGVGSVPLTEFTPDFISTFYQKLTMGDLPACSVWFVHLLLRRILCDA